MPNVMSGAWTGFSRFSSRLLSLWHWEILLALVLVFLMQWLRLAFLRVRLPLVQLLLLHGNRFSKSSRGLHLSWERNT